MVTGMEILLEEWAGAIEGLGAGFSAINSVFSGLNSIIGIATYVLSSLVLYTIAQRRNLDKPWAAWVPVGNAWLIGCLSDQFRDAAYGEQTKRGKDLLKHGIGYVVTLTVYIQIWLLFMVVAVVMGIAGEEIGFGAGAGILIFALILMIAALTVMLIFAVRYYIRFYKALYDVYVSCFPSMAILFILISIFAPGGQAVALMFCRNRDDGMPQYSPLALPEGE